jgi:hypothetical protein
MAQKRSSRVAASVSEARRIQALVNKIGRPKGIRGFELQFGDDATGDPALWVHFILEPDYPTSPAEIRALTDLRLRVSEAILKDGGTNRIPYTDFREMRTEVA